MQHRRTCVELGSLMLVMGVCLGFTGCDKSSAEKKPASPPSLAEVPKSGAKPTGETKPAPPANAPANAEDAPKPSAAEKPAGEPKTVPPNPHAPMGDPHANMAGAPPAAPKAQADVAGSSLTLVGISMTIPDGWVHEPTPSGPMAAAAVFRLPKAEGDADDGMVRVTYFPNMKGMDDSNLQRWLGQVSKPDGSPLTLADAKIAKSEMGAVKLTTLDAGGNVKATMRAEPMPNGRMLATIVDHPQGPHFVVATGGAATMKKWEVAVDAFLKSAKVKE